MSSETSEAYFRDRINEDPQPLSFGELKREESKKTVEFCLRLIHGELKLLIEIVLKEGDKSILICMPDTQGGAEPWLWKNNFKIYISAYV